MYFFAAEVFCPATSAQNNETAVSLLASEYAPCLESETRLSPRETETIELNLKPVISSILC